MSILAMHLPGAAILLAVALWLNHALGEQRRAMRQMRGHLTKMREESHRVERMLDEAEETLRAAREAGETIMTEEEG